MRSEKRPASRRAATPAKAPLKTGRSTAASAKSAKAGNTRPAPQRTAAATHKRALTPAMPAGAGVVAKSPGNLSGEKAAADVYRLTGSLVIRDTRASLAQLCAALETGCTCVDVSGIDTIDTSGVQLLLAAAMEWRRREQPLTLTGFEHLVFGAAEQLGLQKLLPITPGIES